MGVQGGDTEGAGGPKTPTRILHMENLDPAGNVIHCAIWQLKAT